MKGIRLSRTGRTERPFYVSSISVNLYSVEELLYFLHKYPALIDDGIRSPELTRWLASEFGLGDTAVRMDRGLRLGKTDGDFLLPLFRDTGYLSSAELRRYTGVLDALGKAPWPERLMKKADALMRNGRYQQAVAATYQAEESAPGADPDFLASLYCGRGAALMQLMAMEEAAAAYEKAYRLSPSEERLKVLLCALRITKTEEAYLLRAEELGASSGLLAEIDERIREAAEEVPDPEDPDEALREIREAYHRETGH